MEKKIIGGEGRNTRIEIFNQKYCCYEFSQKRNYKHLKRKQVKIARNEEITMRKNSEYERI
jgi:hypothetical protein